MTMWASVFWGGVALAGSVDLALAAGAFTGKYPYSIAADALSLVKMGNGALGLALLALSFSGIGAQGLPGAWGQRLAGALLCAAALGLWAWESAEFWKHLPASEMGRGYGVSFIQGNTEGKGNPADWGARIVFLCELKAEDKEELGAKAAEAGLNLAAGFGPGEGSAIWASFKAIESGALGKAEGGWRTQAVWALLEGPGGPFLAISVHAEAPHDEEGQIRRDDFLEELGRFAASRKEPILMAGDFNATPQGKTMRAFLGQTKALGPSDRASPTWPSYLADWGAGFRIDHVLGFHGARVIEWAPMGKNLSDHLFSQGLAWLPEKKGP